MIREDLQKYDAALLGGSGFIGSILANALTLQKKKVVSFGRELSDSIDSSVQQERLDFKDEGALQEKLAPTKAVYILLGQNHAAFDSQAELAYLDQIIVHINQWEEPTKVIYFSTALVYGDCEEKVSEAVVVHPVEKYSQFKKEAEELLQQKVGKQHSLLVLRLANVYGSPKNKGFIGLLMRAVAEGNTLTLNGGGKQERDYIFVDDVIEAVLVVGDKITKPFDVVNIATGTSYSLLEVLQLVESVTEKSITYTIVETVPEEVKRSLLNPEKLEKEYGYKTRTTLREGLGKTWLRYQ